MPTYIMLSTLTPEGVQTVKNNPARIREVNKEVEQLGATVKAQWATLGHFDFINIVEAPDEKTMARVSLELGSRGTVALRDADGDPDRRLHRLAVSARPGRRRRRSRARDRPRAAALAAAPGGALRPGQPGILRDAGVLDVGAGDVEALARAAVAAGVDLVVAGPEAPLVDGLADACAAAGVPCFGPRRGRARLEGSKAYSKEVMLAAGVPTAAHAVVTPSRTGWRRSPAIRR